MSRGRSVLRQRTIWTALAGAVAVAFWIVALGTGLRAWLTLGPRPGLVGHVTAFGEAAAPFMITAAVLTTTTAVLGIGTAIVRHLVDGPVEVREPLPEREALPAKRPITPKEPLPEKPATGGPAGDRPTAEQPRAGQPAKDGPAKEGPATDEPAIDGDDSPPTREGSGASSARRDDSTT